MGADLTRSDLSDADLNDADLWKAKLEEAKLFGANMQGIRLDQACWNGAVYDETTKWPEGFDPESFGAIGVCKSS